MLGNHVETPVADWPTKRAWVDYAFDELAAAGYSVSSAYTMVKDKNEGELQLPRQPVARHRPVGHRRGQLRARLGRPLSERARVGRLRRPRSNAASCRCTAGMQPTPHQLLVREMILQLKTGRLDAATSATSSASTSSTNGATPGSNFTTKAIWTSTPTQVTPDPRRPAARRRPVAGLLRAGTPRRAVHVSGGGRHLLGVGLPSVSDRRSTGGESIPRNNFLALNRKNLDMPIADRYSLRFRGGVCRIGPRRSTLRSRVRAPDGGVGGRRAEWVTRHGELFFFFSSAFARECALRDRRLHLSTGASVPICNFRPINATSLSGKWSSCPLNCGAAVRTPRAREVICVSRRCTNSAGWRFRCGSTRPGRRNDGGASFMPRELAGPADKKRQGRGSCGVHRPCPK